MTENLAPATEATARMRVENAQCLTELARQRHRDSLHRAEQALVQLADTGEPVTVARLANRAGVSRSWIYTQPELREQIQQLQQQRVGAHHVQGTVTRASDESLRRRLALAHQRITELRTENQELRDALAHAHGQLRTARQHTGAQQV